MTVPCLPHAPFRQLLSTGVDHTDEATIIGRQFFSWAAGGVSEADHYRWKVAPARNYIPSVKARTFFITCDWSVILRLSGCSERWAPGRRGLLTAEHLCDGVSTNHRAAIPFTGFPVTRWPCGARKAADDFLNDFLRPVPVAQAAVEQAKAGLAMGGSRDCSVVGYGDRWYDPGMVRFFDDEPARHKMVDLTVRGCLHCCCAAHGSLQCLLVGACRRCAVAPRCLRTQARLVCVLSR